MTSGGTVRGLKNDTDPILSASRGGANLAPPLGAKEHGGLELL